MSLERNIYIGSHSVKNYQTKLDIHGNNLANVSTVGFKQTRMNSVESFQEQLHNAVESDGATSQLNSQEGGFGQSRPHIYIDSRNGILQETGNPLDLAVEGDGYFMVEWDGQKRFTRDGNFALDKNKSILLEGNGAHLLGWLGSLNADGGTDLNVTAPTQRLALDSVSFLPAKTSTLVDFSSNLNSESPARNMTVDKSVFPMVDERRNTMEYSSRWDRTGKNEFQFTLHQNGEEHIKFSIPVDTLGNMTDLKIDSLADGVELIKDDSGKPTGFSWTYPSPLHDEPEATLTRLFSLPSRSELKDTGSAFSFRLSNGSEDPVSLNNEFLMGTIHNTTTRLVDTLGNSHSVTFAFENMSSEESFWEYRVYLEETSPYIQDFYRDPANGINFNNPTRSDYERANQAVFGSSGTGKIVFDNDGLINSSQSQIPTLIANLPATRFVSDPAQVRPAANLNTKLDMDLITGFGAPFSTSVRNQNGYVAGDLIRSTVSSNGDGKIIANFTNGQARILGQIAIGVFTNAQGLVRDGNNMFRAGVNAGEDNLTVNIPSSGRRGLIRPGFLEASNVNMIEEFTQLIVTQRSLQANSKIITTADSLLQTGIGIKR
ncbi:MAG: flagellar hook-basal body complex protein [Candidatus Cloacimonetes bacterium]|nr:flagellar hook-basal body complex protein [Candidatus Cloacimonadota bacterium]